MADHMKPVPLTDLGADTYRGYPGGLYPNGMNRPSASYLQAGLHAAAEIGPLDSEGKPDSHGKIVLLSAGMSNTTMEFSAFRHLAEANERKRPEVTLVDGAQGGQHALIARNPDAVYWSVTDERIAAAGASPKQVQAVWLKQAIARESKSFPEDALRLKEALRDILFIICRRYPNVRLIYLSSRIYAGYATTPLNPEPYAYEGGFAVKWLVEEWANASAEGRLPWVGWGPYLWADGTNARSDGLVWEPNDLSEKDGTHPSKAGSLKVAGLLLNFFQTDPTARPWFIGE